MIAGPFHLDDATVAYVWRQPRATSSFYLWLAAAFVAGIIVTLLAQLVLGALLSTSSRSDNSGPTSEIEGSAARAGRMVEARAEDDPSRVHETARSSAVLTGQAPSSVDPARANSAIDEPPAASAPSASPRTMVAPLRDDPPASSVVSILRAAAAEFGVDPEQLVAIARCESRFDPLAIGAYGEIGVLQFRVQTFARNAALLGYRVDQIFDIEAQARTAASKLAREGPWAWSCAR